MLAKNRSLNEIYYKLLLNSPQMITMDIPLKIAPSGKYILQRRGNKCLLCFQEY